MRTTKHSPNKTEKDLFDKYPNFCRRFEKFYAIADPLMMGFTFFCAAIGILVPTFLIYFSFDNNTRESISAIVGTLLSVIIVPFTLNYYNKKKEAAAKRFEKNQILYDELSTIIISLITKTQYTNKDAEKVLNYFANHYDKMCLSVSSTIISNIYWIYRACKNNDSKNVKFFCTRCIKLIRKECDANKNFGFMPKLLTALEEAENKKARHKIVLHYQKGKYLYSKIK